MMFRNKYSAGAIVIGSLFSFSVVGPAYSEEVPDVGVAANGASIGVVATVTGSKLASPKAVKQQPATANLLVKPSLPPVATSILTVINDITNSFAGLRVEPLGFEFSRSVCPDGQQAFTIKRFTPNVANNAGILGSATRTCETPTAAAQVTAATPPITVTQTMFQSLPLKQRRTECNCGQGKEQLPYGTVTVPIVFWQDNTPETVTTTMLGQIIEVQATPIHWSMNFGDNTPLWNSKTPGVAYHDNYKIIHPDTIPGTIWHAWEHRGRYPITQTITYSGQFRVNGGPWQPIPGNATKPGPSTTVIINSYVALEVAPDYYPDN